MPKFNSSQLSLLDELSELYPLFCIIDNSGTFEPEIYVCNEHVTATAMSPFLSFRRWIRITQIIEANSLYVNNQNSLTTVVTQIDNLKIVNKERKFDNSFTWIKF